MIAPPAGSDSRRATGREWLAWLALAALVVAGAVAALRFGPRVTPLLELDRF